MYVHLSGPGDLCHELLQFARHNSADLKLPGGGTIPTDIYTNKVCPALICTHATAPAPHGPHNMHKRGTNHNIIDQLVSLNYIIDTQHERNNYNIVFLVLKYISMRNIITIE